MHILKKLADNDNVALAIDKILAGEKCRFNDREIDCLDDIRQGHKVCVTDIGQDQPVYKFNQFIGYATCDIQTGQHVHEHNLRYDETNVRTDAAEGAGAHSANIAATNDTFKGYRRENGIGTRNYLGVIASVNCSATVVKAICEAINSDGLMEYDNIDGIVPVIHGSGCGHISGNQGHEVLKRTLAGYAKQVNFGFALMVGLGCEDTQLANLLDQFSLDDPTRYRAINIQECGGTKKTIDCGVQIIREKLPDINNISRESCPVSHLTVGLQCGGSDAYSGMTANPALGVAADILVANGGTVYLGETPEIYGAEHLLTSRAISTDVAKKLLEKIEWWKNYTAVSGGTLNNNPSPGNKAGGITTILEKSLGAVAKGGSTTLVDVIDYAEQARKPGLNFMDTPGYDPVSVTGMVAGGANVVCFTTGRGSVYGCKPSPSIKLSTNSRIFELMGDDIDINCGVIMDNDISVSEMGRKIYDMVIRIASGEQTKSERFGIGDYEFVPWQIGAVM